MAGKVRSILYATTNPGKVLEVRKYLQSFGIALLSRLRLVSRLM